MIKIRCPSPTCRKVLAVKSELAGKKGRCPICGQAMTIPQLPGAEATTPTLPDQTTGNTIRLQRAPEMEAAAPSPDAAAPPAAETQTAPEYTNHQVRPATDAVRVAPFSEQPPLPQAPAHEPPPVAQEPKAEETAQSAPIVGPPQELHRVPAPEEGEITRQRRQERYRTTLPARSAPADADASYRLEGNNLRVAGAIGYDLNPVFRSKCEELLQSPEAELTLDLSVVMYLSSSHLGVLAELLTGAANAGKKVRLVASGKAARVIKLAGLNRLCEMEIVEE